MSNAFICIRVYILWPRRPFILLHLHDRGQTVYIVRLALIYIIMYFTNVYKLVFPTNDNHENRTSFKRKRIIQRTI